MNIKNTIVIASMCFLAGIFYAKGETMQLKSQIHDTLTINRLLDRSFDLLSSNLDSAYLLANTALSLSEQDHYDKGLGSAYMRFGAVMNYKGKSDSALFYFHKALGIREKLNDKRAIAGACVSLSYVFQTLGYKDSAFYFHLKAVGLNEETGDSVRIAQSYNTLGNLYDEYKDDANALLYYNRSLRIYKNMHDTADISFGYNGLGIYYYHKKEDTTALRYFLMSKQIDEKLNNPEALSRDYNNIALCYKDLHNNYEALIYYRKSLALSEKNKEYPAIARDYSNIGILYLGIQQTDSTIFYLQKSVVLGRQVSDKELLSTNYKSLADAYAQKGDYENAFEYHKEYSALNDSLLNEEKIKTIGEMVAKYDNSHKERMIALLYKENKTEAARRYALIGGWILLFLLMVGIIYIYVQRQNLSKKNEQIASQRISDLLKEQEIKTYNAMLDGQEDERQRIAGDLHDRLGSMLATVKMHFNVLDDNIMSMGEQNVNQHRRANALLDEACAEVRKISHNLSTGMIMSFGLIPALQELSESVGSTGKMNCKVLVYGLHERLETNIEISVYRMIQEIFSNILRHAQAKNVTVQLNNIDDVLTITVEDDGAGFNVEDTLKGSGIGLKSVLLRIEKLKGNFTIDSSPGKGTIAILELPLNTEEV